IFALNAASNFLRDFVIFSLLRVRKSRTLHTLTGGPKSGVHFNRTRILVNPIPAKCADLATALAGEYLQCDDMRKTVIALERDLTD
ncbi:MAG: hypothetical protein ACLQIQ_15320, partial [Beijerinckiaceae bacterium]